MSLFRSKNTQLEKRVRSFIHGRGLRFKLNSERNRKLPCQPDIVLPRYGTVIFVHGCYWHRHSECKSGSDFPKNPEKGSEFWKKKFRMNVERDRRNTIAMCELGWNVEIVWGCQSKNVEVLEALVDRIKRRGPYKRDGSSVAMKSK